MLIFCKQNIEWCCLSDDIAIFKGLYYNYKRDKKGNMVVKNKIKILSVILTLLLFLNGCGIVFTNDIDGQTALFSGVSVGDVASVSQVPSFSDEPYVIINGNKPDFSDSDLVTEAYEYYSPLDSLGRCGFAMACIGTEIMPTEERGAIGMVKPTGWHTVKYDNVDGKYLYNRCHLIGYQLTGENANTQNLITGTRYLNIEGMLPFENLVADYIKETENHVIYRVTPIFDGDNLLANGVQLEAFSVEDGGKEICFNVYAYNVQPDIVIDYATGESYHKDEKSTDSDDETQSTSVKYILNKSSKKIHLPECSSVKSIKPQNKKESDKTLEELTNEGYTPCQSCMGNN